jgi:hypothetical protein
MAQLPTGAVTFLFTDIEGSTKLLHRLGPDYARAGGASDAAARTLRHLTGDDDPYGPCRRCRRCRWCHQTLPIPTRLTRINNRVARPSQKYVCSIE